MYIIDTNILINNPNILEDLEIKDIYISFRVLEEIDGLKKNSNPEVAYKARRASYYISSNISNINFISKQKRNLSVDNELLYLAKKNKLTLITNDLNLKIKCMFNKVKCESYNKTNEINDGVVYWDLDIDKNNYSEELELALENNNPPKKMLENQFLIVRNKNEIVRKKNGQESYKDFAIFRNIDNKLIPINNQVIKNDFIGKIIPRNPEQKCLMDLLNDNSISILAAIGSFGTGKSMLTINYALQELQKGSIDKIVYVPNNSFNKDSREIGTLPGTLIEKEIIHMGTLVDIVGAPVLEDMINKNLIEVVPISIMRGRSFNNSIILVNEAQNLTEDHIKLLIARCGDNTRIFFDGDIKQTDSSIFKEKNGLRLLSNLSKSPIFSKLFGTVRLVDIERSLTAQASDFLDMY